MYKYVIAFLSFFIIAPVQALAFDDIEIFNSPHKLHKLHLIQKASAQRNWGDIYQCLMFSPRDNHAATAIEDCGVPPERIQEAVIFMGGMARVGATTWTNRYCSLGVGGGYRCEYNGIWATWH